MKDTRVAIITGASAGIGAATVRKFVEEGVAVVALGRSQEKLDTLASVGGKIATLAIDVAADEAPRAAVALAMKEFGRLDYLVNNAGGGKWAPIHESSDELLDEMYRVDLRAPMRFCREALTVMKPGSAMVNMASTFGLIGGLRGGVYCAVKAGIIGFTQTMAAQYGSRGIRSNAVAPGVVATDLTTPHWNNPIFQRMNQEMTPMDREGTSADVANAIFYLCSDAGGYINGQVLAIDGGWSTTKYLSPAALLSERVAGT